MSFPTVLPTSGGHTHGAPDVRSATPTGAVLLDNGTWGQAGAAGLSANAVTTAKLADDAVTTAKLDPATIQYAEVSLTSQQVKALRATPQVLVAAQGAGTVIEFVSGLVCLDYGTNAFTETADNLALYYDSTTGVSEVIETTGFIDQTADMVIEVRPTSSAAKAATAAVNKAITVKNTGDGEIGGDAANGNVLRFKIAYRVHATGF
ncbi:MAG TPA: hypothetical protein PKC83_11005 [Gemmatimonadaceae bacterium]|nr:hypothetical protein [Gemmatimonadaceae bacterium]